MSIELMSRVWREADLPSNEVHVLVALCDHAEDDGTQVFPSMERLAWKCRLSRRQVQRIVGNLRVAGILEVVAKSSQHRPTEYRILPVWKIKEPFIPRGDNMSYLKSGMTSTTVRDDIYDTPGVTPMSLEPSIETSVNRQLEESSFVSEGLSEDQIQKLIADDPSCGLF